jgi:acyl-CoA thioester hydrolase
MQCRMDLNSPSTPFAFPIRVYWEDTDAGGIVFYANYLKFFERARTEWLRSLGIGQQALKDETGGMFVVVETQMKYHRPARLDDLMRVTSGIKEIGRSGIVLQQSALLISEQTMSKNGARNSAENDAKIPTLLCDGTIRIGWVDAASMRPARIPATVLAALTANTA